LKAGVCHFLADTKRKFQKAACPKLAGSCIQGTFGVIHISCSRESDDCSRSTLYCHVLPR